MSAAAPPPIRRPPNRSSRTPPRRDWDLATEKSVRVMRGRAAIRAEVINLLNVADLRGPDIAFGDATFGQIREAAGFPRMLQLSLRAAW